MNITFAGYEWTIKDSAGSLVGPGPNYFSNSCISVENDELTIQVINDSGNILCGEVILTQSLGYGKYIFQLASRVDLLANNLVLGIFTWSYSDTPNNSEVDIEFSKWNNETVTNSQYVVQPPSVENLHRFTTTLDEATINTTHIIEWKPNEINFSSMYGCYLASPSELNIIQSWTNTGASRPTPADESIHINLWKYGIDPSLNIDPGQLTYATIKGFYFYPY